MPDTLDTFGRTERLPGIGSPELQRKQVLLGSHINQLHLNTQLSAEEQVIEQRKSILKKTFAEWNTVAKSNLDAAGIASYAELLASELASSQLHVLTKKELQKNLRDLGAIVGRTNFNSMSALAKVDRVRADIHALQQNTLVATNPDRVLIQHAQELTNVTVELISDKPEHFNWPTHRGTVVGGEFLPRHMNGGYHRAIDKQLGMVGRLAAVTVGVPVGALFLSLGSPKASLPWFALGLIGAMPRSGGDLDQLRSIGTPGSAFEKITRKYPQLMGPAGAQLAETFYNTSSLSPVVRKVLKKPHSFTQAEQQLLLETFASSNPAMGATLRRMLTSGNPPGIEFGSYIAQLSTVTSPNVRNFLTQTVIANRATPEAFGGEPLIR